MKKYLLMALCGLLFASCGEVITRGVQYPKMYEEKPASILIMPPINNTVLPDAKEFFYSSLSYPLSELGYYVVSPFLSMDLLKQESAYDSEMFLKGNLQKFKDVFDADAALFTIINKWKKSTLSNNINIEIEYILRSTRTGQTLYNRKGEISVDCSVSTDTGWSGLLLNALSTAVTDKVVAARKCNWYVLSDLPRGKYSSLFEKDKGYPAGKMILSGTVSR